MKYLILVIDGAADYPLGETGNRTPLDVAEKPHVDSLAAKGAGGLLKTIPGNFPACSAVANLSILGYDPARYFSGRGVLEAAAMGILLEADDVALRCNTICVENGNIKNHSAGHISSEEAALLIGDIDRRIGGEKIRFYGGFGYRHLLVLKGGFSPEVECSPPHDFAGMPFSKLMVRPRNASARDTARELNRIILESFEILKEHPVNIRRAKEGKDAANMLWPWSPGKKPGMKTFQERFSIKGAVISAVDLIKGLGIYSGFDVIRVEGATGLHDTNYEGKAEACIKALKEYDLVYLHVEAADEASHEGDLALKIKCIEDFDRRLVSNILGNIDLRNTAIAVLPDHYTPVKTRAHSSEPVPFIICGPGRVSDRVESFCEKCCAAGNYGTIEGGTFIREFLYPGTDGKNMDKKV